MVHETGAHSTDVEEAEPVEHLCGKCEAYACEDVYKRQVCYTSKNMDAVTSDEFFDLLIEHGSLSLIHILLPAVSKEECYAYRIVEQVCPEIADMPLLCMPFPMIKDCLLYTSFTTEFRKAKTQNTVENEGVMCNIHAGKELPE